jgi:DNA-binding winged helix-turn-helix (wHTH) protein
MKDSKPEHVIRFGQFELRRDARALTKSGIPLHLQEQPLELLLALLERPGEIVSRAELQKRLWPEGTFVDFDQSLNKAVNKVREALGDSAEHPLFIETLARRGYRFIASVQHVTPAGGKPWRSWRRAIWPAIALIAFVVTISLLMHRPPAPVKVSRYKRLTTDGQRKTEWALATDGHRVYYTDRIRARLVEVSVLGGEPRPLEIPIRAFPLDFSRANEELLVAEWTPQTAPYAGHDDRPIWIVRLPTGAARSAGGLRATDAVWSPDGRYITYTTADSLALSDAAGKNVRTLAKVNGAPLSPSWSRDRQTVRFLTPSRP